MLTSILIVFVLGYVAIALEHSIKVNKAAAALVTGVLCWTLYMVLSPDAHHGADHLGHQVNEIAQILFFLIGAMTVVELIDLHGGFEIITDRIRTRNKVKLLWIISLITFFLSAALDNLTTAIVMISVVGKLMDEKKDRWLFGGMIVLAANAGGAWSPIGDVTTTMLWIADKITPLHTIASLILPSLVSILVPLLLLSLRLKGEIKEKKHAHRHDPSVSEGQKRLVLLLGLGGLLFVPVFKVVTHLPPFMGMMLSLGVLWVVTELMHGKKQDAFKKALSPAQALERIDTPSILFFLGILLAVGALQVSGILGSLAQWLDHSVPNRDAVVVLIGMLSSVVDNVPLVAGTIEMYPLASYPALIADSPFWQFLAYCAGTGGSILIIGSAAGVAVMGIEKIEFFWYLKKISWLALLGYLAGAGVFLLQQML